MKYIGGLMFSAGIVLVVVLIEGFDSPEWVWNQGADSIQRSCHIE